MIKSWLPLAKNKNDDIIAIHVEQFVDKTYQPDVSLCVVRGQAVRMMDRWMDDGYQALEVEFLCISEKTVTFL